MAFDSIKTCLTIDLSTYNNVALSTTWSSGTLDYSSVIYSDASLDVSFTSVTPARFNFMK